MNSSEKLVNVCCCFKSERIQFRTLTFKQVMPSPLGVVHKQTYACIKPWASPVPRNRHFAVRRNLAGAHHFGCWLWSSLLRNIIFSPYFPCGKDILSGPSRKQSTHFIDQSQIILLWLYFDDCICSKLQCDCLPWCTRRGFWESTSLFLDLEHMLMGMAAEHMGEMIGPCCS
jgi:hypothetical protein